MNKKSKKIRQRGITLIALVITIIVLLILAGVTIATLTGNNGILTRAQEAKNKTEESKEDELKKLTELEAITNINGTTHTDNSRNEMVEETVKIPAGFSVSQVEGENTIKDGLVIIDSEGNEFVWIPVDGILGENGKTVQNAVEGEIILGRYVFNSNGDIDTSLTPATLGAELKISSTSSYNYTENSTGKGNTVSKDIEKFIDSVRTNGGYYIARFEASQGKDGKAKSKYNQTVWTDIMQPNAATACQELYSGVNSDLMNSYAWDTAILFIQKYGKEDYSRQDGISISSSKLATGLSGDMQLNIYDIAGNCYEWTTETYSYPNNPCVNRGGGYVGDYGYASYRGGTTASKIISYCSFRPVLYL